MTKTSTACWLALLLPLTAVAAGDDLALFKAVKSRDQTATRILLKQHVDVNASWGDGSTALHWAAHWDDLETAAALIQAGANVNAPTDLGITPVWLACDDASGPMVEKLLVAGANPNATAATGVSALMMCARAGNADGVKAMLAHKADVNAKENARGQTALMWAVAERHPETVRLLIEAGADVRARTVVSELLSNRGELSYGKSATELAETGGSTALLLAARQGDAESTKYLVAGGANVNDAAPGGTSALVIAAHSDNGPVGILLLEKGANPNAAGSGYSALHAAAMRGNLELVRALLAHGANPNALLEKGTTVRRAGPDFALPTLLIGATPFLVAAKFGAADIMRVLASGGADVNLPAKTGMTALMAAAGPDKPGEHGQDAPTPYDETHAMAAVTAALDAGVQINAADRAGNTALHVAASRGYNRVVQLLADKGADPEAKNKSGQTPLKTAIRFKSTGDLLRKLGAKE
jgi:ankyrin repeat protein